MISIDKEQLQMGIEHEKEHTDDEFVAKKIAIDHLKKIPDYYDRLDDMEKEYGYEQEEINRREDYTLNLKDDEDFLMEKTQIIIQDFSQKLNNHKLEETFFDDYSFIKQIERI